MDQWIVANTRDGHASLIDCRDLTTTFVPMPDDVRVVILDTGTRRRVAETRYEERQKACARAAETLGVTSLRDVSLDDVERSGIDATLKRLARHVVTENEWTLLAAKGLAGGDFEYVGGLMNASHNSLRNDFRVSSAALDSVSELARNYDGCVGARMTRGGFAGCAIALMDSEGLSQFLGMFRKTKCDSITCYSTSPVMGVTMI